MQGVEVRLLDPILLAHHRELALGLLQVLLGLVVFLDEHVDLRVEVLQLLLRGFDIGLGLGCGRSCDGRHCQQGGEGEAHGRQCAAFECPVCGGHGRGTPLSSTAAYRVS
jgi:hypothetical protein